MPFHRLFRLDRGIFCRGPLELCTFNQDHGYLMSSRIGYHTRHQPESWLLEGKRQSAYLTLLPSRGSGLTVLLEPFNLEKFYDQQLPVPFRV